MKNYLFLIILFLLVSCKSRFTDNNYSYKLIKIETLREENRKVMI